MEKKILVFLLLNLVFICAKDLDTSKLKIGQKHTSTLIVAEKDLASSFGSGAVRVLATPAMIGIMENSALELCAKNLPEGYTTVGAHISTSHIKPTAPGKKVTATSELISIEGRKLTFKIKAEDEEGTIGEGTHVRFIVDYDKFMKKISSL